LTAPAPGDKFSPTTMQHRRRLPLLLVVTVALGPLRLPAQGIKLPYPLPEIEARARRDSNDAEAQYFLGLGYWNAKRYDDAERALKVSVEIEPRFAAGYLALAYLPYARHQNLRALEERNRIPDTLRDVLTESFRLRRRAFLIDPLVDLSILGAVYPLRGSVTVGLTRDGRLVLMSNPFEAFVAGKYDLAFGVLGDAMYHGLGPPPDLMLWFHGLSAAHLGYYPAAIADFQMLLDRSVQREAGDSILRLPLQTNDYRYILALFKQRANKPADAMALYKEALANDIGLFMAHVQMGKMYEAHQMWPEAIEEFREAVATNPDDPSLLLDLGVVLHEAGRSTESADVLRRAEAANPRDSRVPYHLAIALQEAHDTATARAELQRFLALAPSRYGREIADARQRLAALP